MKALGKQPVASVSTVKAVPTSTHMAIVELQRQNICKYLISQNCDGLHRRSGIAPERISELHGNSNIEYCETCGHEYLRDFACYRKVHGSRDHYTGRHCVMQIDGKLCNGRLMNSTIDFGQNLPVEPLSNAEWNSTKSDLHLCLGSSLTVSPACTMPELTKLRGGKLVIVNLQKTPLTEMADLHIFARTDDVMRAVMQRLQIAIPAFKVPRTRNS
jgi:NAD-dependent SIR2 family protein deacetylase